MTQPIIEYPIVAESDRKNGPIGINFNSVHPWAKIRRGIEFHRNISKIMLPGIEYEKTM